MKFNFTFIVRDNLDKAKHMCNPEVLAVNDSTSGFTIRPSLSSSTNIDDTPKWKHIALVKMFQSCSALIFILYMFSANSQ